MKTLYTIYAGIPEDIAKRDYFVSADVMGCFCDFPGLSLFQGIGIWQHTAEHSVKIELIADDSELQSVINAAEDLRKKWAQDSVLMTRSPIVSHLIEGIEIYETANSDTVESINR